MTSRGWLYLIARLMGDVNAIAKGRAPQRLARVVTGGILLRAWGRLWR